jgi:hypothetical protein
VTTSSVSSSSRASSLPRSRFHLMVRSGRMSSPAERFPLGDFSCPNFLELRVCEVLRIPLPRTRVNRAAGALSSFLNLASRLAALSRPARKYLAVTI